MSSSGSAVTGLTNDLPGIVDAICEGVGRAGNIDSAEGAGDQEETVELFTVTEFSNDVAGVVDAICVSEADRAGNRVITESGVRMT
jgi:hypothetical protein